MQVLAEATVVMKTTGSVAFVACVTCIMGCAPPSIPIKIVSPRFSVAPGPFGELVRAADRATLKAHSVLEAGHYYLRHDTHTIEIALRESTRVNVTIECRMLTGSADDAHWVQPQIDHAAIDFDHPVQIGEGLKVAIRRLSVDAADSHEARIEPVYAETLALLFTRLLFGAGSNTPDSPVNTLLGSAEVESATVTLKPGTRLAIDKSQLDLHGGSKFELRTVSIDREGKASGGWSCALNVVEPTRIVLSSCEIRPHTAMLRLAGTLHVDKDETRFTVADNHANSVLTMTGGTCSVGNLAQLALTQAEVVLKGAKARFDAQRHALTGKLETEDLQLALASGSKLKVGGGNLVCGDPSSLHVSNLVIDYGRVHCAVVAKLTLASGSALSVQGLQLEPQSGALDASLVFEYAAEGRQMHLRSEGRGENHRLTLSDVRIVSTTDETKRLQAQFGSVSADLANWSFVEHPEHNEPRSLVQFSASATNGEVQMPLGHGAVSCKGIAIPKINGTLRDGPGKDLLHCEFPGGVRLGPSEWTLSEGSGTQTKVTCEGVDARMETVDTNWHDVAIDFQGIMLRPATITVHDAQGHTLEMAIAPGARLTPSGPMTLYPASPGKSAVPPWEFKGKVSDVRFSSAALNLGLSDVDTAFTLQPTGNLSLKGSLSGKLSAHGLPKGVDDLVSQGRLQAGNVSISQDGSVSLGHVELKLPRDEVIAEIRRSVASPIQIADHRLTGEIPEVVKDITATHMTANVQLPSIVFAHDAAEVTVKVDVSGQLDGRNRYRALKFETKTVAKVLGHEVKTKVPVYEERWTELEKISGFSGSVSAKGSCRILLPGGKSLLDKRLKAEIKCDQLHIDSLHINNDLLNFVVNGLRAIFGGAIDSEIKKHVNRTEDLPDMFAKVSPEGRVWLGRIIVESASVDSIGNDIVVSAAASIH